MEAIVILVALLLVGPLALVAGTDSRERGSRRLNAWWPEGDDQR